MAVEGVSAQRNTAVQASTQIRWVCLRLLELWPQSQQQELLLAATQYLPWLFVLLPLFSSVVISTSLLKALKLFRNLGQLLEIVFTFQYRNRHEGKSEEVEAEGEF